MKTLIILLAVLAITGCQSTSPLMTGKPKDWMGHSTDELRAGLGEPTRIRPQKDGSEIWEYVKEADFLALGEGKTTFGAVALKGIVIGEGDTKTRGERPAKYVSTVRYQIRDGKVRRWYAEREEDGKVVWSDH